MTETNYCIYSNDTIYCEGVCSQCGNSKVTVKDILKSHNLTDTVNRYRLQIVHEDNDTYYIEDMKFKRSMTRGQVVHTAKDIPELLRYLKNLRCA